jgi:hypothetical protein
MSPPAPASPEVARGPGSRRVRLALAVAAAIYFAGVWLEAAGAPVHEIVPRPFLYFMQVARLFPNAVLLTTEYRAEGYLCEQREWVELDVRPFFPMHADDKESRFERAMFFYHHVERVMKALDQYIVGANNAAGSPAVGGVRLLSLRLPIPPPGTAVEPYRRKPMSEYPAEARKYWYRTPVDDVNARCDEEVYRREPTKP